MNQRSVGIEEGVNETRTNPCFAKVQEKNYRMQKAGKPVGLLAAADPEGVEAKQFMNCFIEI